LSTNFGDFFGVVGCVPGNKRVDSGIDPDHSVDQGILKGIFATVGKRQELHKLHDQRSFAASLR